MSECEQPELRQLLPGRPEQMATRFPSVMREHDFISVIIKVLFALGKLEGPLDCKLSTRRNLQSC